MREINRKNKPYKEALLDWAEAEQYMGESGGAINPEQLFVATWSDCFGTSVTIATGIEKIQIGEVRQKWCSTFKR